MSESKKWSRGRTLRTPQTEKWTPEQIAINDEVEATIIFSDFTSKDAGRGRQRVCVLNAQHPDYEQNAETIAQAPDLLNERDRLKEQNAELLAALIDAKETIKAWHGEDAWDLYQHSPEMKRINEAIQKAEQKA